jgi:hypothetical protein
MHLHREAVSHETSLAPDITPEAEIVLSTEPEQGDTGPEISGALRTWRLMRKYT